MCDSILLKHVWFNHYMVINFWGLYQDIASVLIVGRGGGSSKILLTSKKDNKFNFFFFLNLEFRILLQYSTHEYNIVTITVYHIIYFRKLWTQVTPKVMTTFSWASPTVFWRKEISDMEILCPSSKSYL